MLAPSPATRQADFLSLAPVVMTTPAVVRPEWPPSPVKLSKLHITSPGAHIAGSYQTLLTEETGWDITLRPDLGGVVAAKSAGPKFWIPFAALRNGTLA